jgi:hypothetical protein
MESREIAKWIFGTTTMLLAVKQYVDFCEGRRWDPNLPQLLICQPEYQFSDWVDDNLRAAVQFFFPPGSL